ncbi:hypothetical protein DSM43518_04792 [Mycobacterium marinum]|uniref:hypothetical protein n=1 Tax=Mycobacterium marinum TaxID=1781 RepID=UPI000CD97464|nr:hypothetical protein [Mycobacterium marinum]AXN51250.1 hypothetical protein CCUG20998_03854 [Mycobacterium marinum]RFZ02805.1 hypothetical protein DSM43518_04792 [Mycobacterium marinum]RFZ25996.1 hypothetical protein DSM43519_01310 [Mycobacterium marinum]RFZ28875.1 hypothetical protein DSM44344_01142 [Mycobacterium marinum]RFZ39061.1 hypothetical protein NCTC2275_00329 [Mycobacterium marinum]
MSPTRRETRLLQLVHTLWCEIRNPSGNPGALEWAIRQEGMGWALPSQIDDGLNDDDWLTPDEIAHRLGYATSTIYVWAHRYSLQQINGRYRWGDIKQLR